jgi:predicted Zn-dependent protease
MISKPDAQASDLIAQLFQSFRLLSAQEAASLKPRRIRTVRAGAGDTARTLAARMATDEPMAHFLMLNGRAAGDPVKPGEMVKLVVVAAR